MVISKLWQDLFEYFKLFYQVKFRGYKTDILGKGLRGLGLVFMSFRDSDRQNSLAYVYFRFREKKLIRKHDFYQT